MALIEGLLKKAQIEPFTDAGKPTASDMAYRVIWVSDLGELQVSNGSTWVSVGGSSNASGATLVQELDTSVAGITAGEAITANDACVCIIHNGTGSDVYRVFKTDADFGNKNSFSGFAVASASVTPQITTYTISAAYVASNTIPITINTRNYSTTYASSSDATLQALATLIATDQDVQSATVTVVGGNQTGSDDRVITITSKGGLSLNITSTTVTGGASQPTVTLSNTQTASGGSVDLHQYGPLSGFSGLTTGARYFLSSTAGGITTSYTSPADVYVGQALSSTILFVNPNKFNYEFQSAEGTMLAGAGFTDGDNAVGAAKSTWEHYNFVSWSSGTSQPAARAGGCTSDSGMKGSVYVFDGITGTITSGDPQSAAETYAYNKTSWTNLSDRTTARGGFGVAALSGSMFLMKGSTSQNAASATNALDSFNGSTWVNSVSTFSSSRKNCGGFYYSSKVFCIGGVDTGASGSSTTESWNGSSVTSESAPSLGSGFDVSGGIGMLSFAYVSSYNATHESFKYSGTTWSSNYSIGARICYGIQQAPGGPMGGYNPTTGRAYLNGGSNGSSDPLATTYYFDGTTVSAGTSSSNTGAGKSGGMA